MYIVRVHLTLLQDNRDTYPRLWSSITTLITNNNLNQLSIIPISPTNTQTSKPNFLNQIIYNSKNPKTPAFPSSYPLSDPNHKYHHTFISNSRKGLSTSLLVSFSSAPIITFHRNIPRMPYLLEPFIIALSLSSSHSHLAGSYEPIEAVAADYVDVFVVSTHRVWLLVLFLEFSVLVAIWLLSQLLVLLVLILVV